jgi:Pentapeptide repeats (8 copies)
LINYDNGVKETDKIDNIWRKFAIQSNDYENLLLHRWISLCVLKKIDPTVNLIGFSSNLIPSYIKNLSKVDLSFTDLREAYLGGADLVEAKNLPFSKDVALGKEAKGFAKSPCLPVATLILISPCGSVATKSVLS